MAFGEHFAVGAFPLDEVRDGVEPLRARSNHGCWSDVWLMTSSVTTLRSRAWAASMKVVKSWRVLELEWMSV